MHTNKIVYRNLQKHLDSQPVGFPETKSGVEIRILKHIFSPDEAKIAGQSHVDIMTIAICASICGTNTFKQTEDFGKAKTKWLQQFLELPFGIPSHDTFGRVFACIDPKEFQRCFINLGTGHTRTVGSFWMHHHNRRYRMSKTDCKKPSLKKESIIFSLLRGV